MMRKFQCYDCKHTWELPFGEGGRGVDLTCPQCGSKNVHRASKERGHGRKRGRHNNDSAEGKARRW